MRWPPIPVSKCNLKSKYFWALLNSWFKKKKNVYETYKCLNHANSLLLMKQFHKKIILWKGLMFFTCLVRFTHPERHEDLKEAFPNQTVCHKKLFPPLYELLGNSLTWTVVSYRKWENSHQNEACDIVILLILTISFFCPY